MNVKGAAFLARDALMIAAHGAPQWRDYMDGYAEGEPFFRQPIREDTLIPAEIFLALNDDVVGRFYGGDERAYWTFGVRSAQFALAQGHLKGVFGPGDVQKVLGYTPQLWSAYFDAGRVELHPSGPGLLDLLIADVPVQHVYFEHTVMGFAEGGLKHVGAKTPSPECLHGFSRGDADVLYRFSV